MNQPGRQFTVVEEDEASEQQSSTTQKAAADILMMALGALSQKTVVALASLFTLLTVASAFALWWVILPNPSIFQLIGVGMYAGFILATNLIVRSRRS